MLTISNFSYAGTQKYVSHAVMLSFTNEPKTLCGMDVYELLSRVGQEWEVQETNEPHSVGCIKCLRLLTQRVPDACPQGGLHVYKWDGTLPTDEMIECEKCGHRR